MKVIEKVGRSHWIDVAQSCPYATYYHTPYWADLMGKTFFYKDITKGFVFDDGTRVILPFMYKKRSFLKGGLNDYISGPPYTYGGPISERKLDAQELNEINEYITHTFKNYNTILIRGNPLTRNLAISGFQRVEDCSYVLELYKYEDEGHLFKSYSSLSRNCINKAKRNSMLTIKEQGTLKEFEKLYDIYQGSVKYWRADLTRYPLKLFQNAFFLKNKHMKFWASYYKNKMIGGDIKFYWNDHCCWWLSYYDREYSDLGARRYRMHIDAIDCKTKGLKFYDLGQTAGKRGLEFFKESLAGKVYPHIAWLKENKILKEMRHIKNMVINKLKP